MTHTLSPLHPFLIAAELDCGPELEGEEGDGRQHRPFPCPFTIKDGTLAVTLDKPYGPGDTLDLQGRVFRLARHGLHFARPTPPIRKSRFAIWTQGESEDTHYWLPCYDYPNDRATSEMIITVENPLFVVSNGR